jgi:proline racemase
MSTTTAVIETGMVQPIDPETRVIFDIPAGLMEARARIEENRAIEVPVANLPSFLYVYFSDCIRHTSLDSIGSKCWSI